MNNPTILKRNNLSRENIDYCYSMNKMKKKSFLKLYI